MPVVCSHCKNYVERAGIACPVCGETVVAAGPYTWRDQWRESWQMDKHALPFFLLIGGTLLAMFLFIVFQSK